jgi:hypothetical protein
MPSISFNIGIDRLSISSDVTVFPFAVLIANESNINVYLCRFEDQVILSYQAMRRCRIARFGEAHTLRDRSLCIADDVRIDFGHIPPPTPIFPHSTMYYLMTSK